MYDLKLKPAHNMVYNALATKWHDGYERKPQFCIFLGKNSAMQSQRYHTPGTLCVII
jgi:hypothetical protein